jgi:hypothetical protein
VSQRGNAADQRREDEEDGNHTCNDPTHGGFPFSVPITHAANWGVAHGSSDARATLERPRR